MEIQIDMKQNPELKEYEIKLNNEIGNEIPTNTFSIF